jgi:hypothetical protein
VEDDVTDKIKASTTGTTSCLTVVQSRQVKRIACEDNGLTRHVDTKSESSSGDNNSEKSLSEQDFDTGKLDMDSEGISLDKLTFDDTSCSYQNDGHRHHASIP